ncbi:MAG TPA: PHB depolymerase family esterase [Planctomycetota bacterium]|jgi:enterochelin esterase-like enzyme|nr:PHB depolymerase family esterase [Planctomycetota bacterium]
MKRTTRLTPALLLVVPVCIAFAASVAPAPRAGGEDALKPADHDSLGKVIAAFKDASRNNKNVDKARADVAAELDKFRKRLKGRDPLSLTTDLGKALWQSINYDTAKNVKKGKVSDVKFKDSDFDLTYATWAPPKYEPKKAYPLILCIPDKGEKPTEHLTEKWIGQEIRENVVLAAVPMPDDVAQWSDPGSKERGWGGAANLYTVFREVSLTYGTDFDRVYIAGRGVGVQAALAIAARSPDRFAGVIGRSGDVGDTPPENFHNLPTFFAGAGAGATAFGEKATKAGNDNCTIKPEGTEDDIWSWMKDHPRIAYPAQVVLLPGTPNPSKAYWLGVKPWDGQGTAIVKGSIDRATNAITIDGEGVTGIYLCLNDVLVDLDKPVKVVCNGAEHLEVIPRNLGTFLDYAMNRSDPGKICVATREFDLPAKPKPK